MTTSDIELLQYVADQYKHMPYEHEYWLGVIERALIMVNT